MLTCRLDFTPSIPSVLPDESSNFLHGFRHKSFYSGEIRGMEYLMALRERSGIYIKKSIRLAMIYSYWILKVTMDWWNKFHLFLKNFKTSWRASMTKKRSLLIVCIPSCIAQQPMWLLYPKPMLISFGTLFVFQSTYLHLNPSRLVQRFGTGCLLSDPRLKINWWLKWAGCGLGPNATERVSFLLCSSKYSL